MRNLVISPRALARMGRSFRMMLQSGVLAVGAYLMIDQQAGRRWGDIVGAGARTGRSRDFPLAQLRRRQAGPRAFEQAARAAAGIAKLRRRCQSRNAGLTVENVSAAPPDVQRAVVHEVSFALKAGNGLGVIGPSTSGKSSLRAGSRSGCGHGRAAPSGLMARRWMNGFPMNSAATSAICRRTSD